jgi:probable phosphoglycerate mutase
MIFRKGITMKKLIFVRHAEAVGNKIREFHGWTDENITERGHLQAKQVAQRLKDTKIDVIYSSILKRTMETAGYISRQKNLPIISREDLKEINGGLWEGMRWEDLPIDYPKEYDTWENRPHIHQMPEGESMESFQQRQINAILDIISKEDSENICIVSHGTAIRVLLCWFKGMPLKDIINIPWFDNTAVTIVSVENGQFQVQIEGDVSHLDKETSTLENQQWYIDYQEKYFGKK